MGEYISTGIYRIAGLNSPHGGGFILKALVLIIRRRYGSRSRGYKAARLLGASGFSPFQHRSTKHPVTIDLNKERCRSLRL